MIPAPGAVHEAPLPPEGRTPGGVRVLLGVRYAAPPRCRPLELDLYLPERGVGPAPVVVHLHGGAWRVGSRSGLPPSYAGRTPGPFEELVAAGVAVASVDYRLSGEAVWPAQLHDVKAAVRWLRARAGETGLDPARVGAWGESAGAHLALLLGLTGAGTALEGDLGATGPSSAVGAVAAWYPPSDLLALPDDRGADPHDAATPEALVLGAPAVEDPERARQASPVDHVDDAAPPVLLLHGEADAVIPVVQSERLAATLEAAGGDVELVTYPGADHMWLGSDQAAEQALVATVGFLRRALSAVGE